MTQPEAMEAAAIFLAARTTVTLWVGFLPGPASGCRNPSGSEVGYVVEVKRKS